MDLLKTLDRRGGVVWIDYRSSVVKDRADKLLESCNKTFLVFAERSVRERSDDVDARVGSPSSGDGVAKTVVRSGGCGK